MNIKTILITVILIICAANTYGQNTIMAQAFYKKAQQSYVDGNYNTVLTLLKKTKETPNFLHLLKTLASLLLQNTFVTKAVFFF